MRIALVIAVAVASLWLLAAGRAVAPAGRQEPVRVASVSIQYTYMGWGYVDERFHLVPARNGIGFVMRWTDKEGTRHPEQPVATDKVMALFAAARAPRVDRATGLGVVQQRAMAPETIARIRNTLFAARDCSPLQQRQWRAAQATAGSVRTEFEQLYREAIPWTDDSPSMTVRIVPERGAPLVFHSQSQKPFMLAWIHGMPGGRRDEAMDGPTATWSLPLSDALVEILPALSPARKRLAREQLVGVLARNLERRSPSSCSQDRGNAHAGR
ncbi:hypothetical protein J7373_20170 [Xanthomonas sp. A2111]|uniref:Uncharacterized protein n=1 Tax=Xanthomonas hawaiiensis TaxID=3003247 RepID=A0ABU2I4K7_9XANT|nr:hypothetical protein [Xanthomonas sp. A2111]MBO9830575.1 hypothetical protein [Xanthomonas sp. A2111]MDS9992780.1 hypothetical protein [Xanthomonas sp. A2111]